MTYEQSPYDPPPEQQYQPHGGYQPGQPQLPYPTPGSSRKWVWLGVGAAAFVVLAGAGITVALLAGGGNPVSDLIVGEDPGVEACEAIRDAEQDSTDSGDEPLTFEEYQRVRGLFADSEHEAIRSNGIKLIDIAWQIEQLGDDAGLEALPLVGSFVEAYAGLSGGCAEQGIQLPPLEFDTP